MFILMKVIPATKLTHYQHYFKMNVWIEVIGNSIIGPVVIPNSLNGDNYFKHYPNLLEDLLLLLCHGM